MINDNKSDMIPFMSSFSATRKARLTYDRLWLSCSDRKWLQRETGTMNRRECMFFILSIFLKYINFAVLSFNEYIDSNNWHITKILILLHTPLVCQYFRNEWISCNVCWANNRNRKQLCKEKDAATIG